MKKLPILFWSTAGAVGVAVVFAVIFASLRSPASTTPPGLPVAPSADEVARIESYQFSADLSGEALVRGVQREVRSHNRRLRMSEDDATRLGEQAGRLLSIYRDGGPTDFGRWLRSQDIDARIWGDAGQQERAAQLWERWTGPLEEARFDLQRAEVVYRVRAGRPVPPPGNALPSMSAGLPQSVPGYVDPVREGLDAVEVIVPAQMRTNTGESFSGRVGMTFVKRRDGSWVISEVTLYDLPRGVGFRSLPL